MDIGPEFRVLKAGEGPRSSNYILLVHRFSADKRALVHDISGSLNGAEPALAFLSGANAFTGTPGDALRKADCLATQHRVPVVYVRDDTGL